jgi:hypothetical protein
MAVAIAKVIVNPVVNARLDRGEPTAARFGIVFTRFDDDRVLFCAVFERLRRYLRAKSKVRRGALANAAYSRIKIFLCAQLVDLRTLRDFRMRDPSVAAGVSRR